MSGHTSPAGPPASVDTERARRARARPGPRRCAAPRPLRAGARTPRAAAAKGAAGCLPYRGGEDRRVYAVAVCGRLAVRARGGRRDVVVVDRDALTAGAAERSPCAARRGRCTQAMRPFRNRYLLSNAADNPSHNPNGWCDGTILKVHEQMPLAQMALCSTLSADKLGVGGRAWRRRAAPQTRSRAARGAAQGSAPRAPRPPPRAPPRARPSPRKTRRRRRPARRGARTTGEGRGAYG